LGDAIGKKAYFHVDSMLAEDADALAIYQWIGVLNPDIDGTDPGGNDGIGTGGSFAKVGARLQCDVEFRISGSGSGLAECYDFCMVTAIGASATLADHSAIFHDYGSNEGIGGADPAGSLGDPDRLFHKDRVICHSSIYPD